MTTDTTRLRAACENTARAQRDFRAADSAGSGHVAAASVLMEACADLSTHVPVILALLDEVDRLRSSLDLAYPRALQAAASLVTVESVPQSVLDDAPEVHRWVGEVADAILDLSAEQIEAYDAKVEREHAAAVAPKPEPEDAREWCWRRPSSEACQGPYATREEAIHDARHGWCEEGPIEVGRCTPPMDALDTPDADDMREHVNDILCDEGLDAHATILDEPAADAALREWFLRYVEVDGMQWIARDEETVWPDEPEEGGEHG